MDTALTSSIVRTATTMAQQETSDALNIRVLKKAIDIEQTAAATLLAALPQPPAAPQLAPSGALGTQVNTYA